MAIAIPEVPADGQKNMPPLKHRNSPLGGSLAVVNDVPVAGAPAGSEACGEPEWIEQPI